MKKLFIIFLACIMVTGCSHSKTTENAKISENETTTEQYVEEATTEEFISTEEIEMQGSETIALFGVDSRSNTKGKGTRSDCIILAQINHDTKEVRLASVLRDTFVSIKDHGYTKINHAYDYGGPDLEIETLNENFDLDIKDYVSVSFEDLSKVVDSIGGVEMEITESETKYINGYIAELNKINHTNAAEITKAGEYTLDGTQAVAYTRIRYTAGGDYKRTERQRDILLKVFEKTKTLEHNDKLRMIVSLLPAITTSYKDKMTLAEALTNYDIVGQKTFPDKFWGGKLSDGIWYAVPVSLKGNVKKLHKFLYPEEKYHPSETVKERSDVISGYADQANEDLPNDPSLNETENGEF